MSAAYVSNGDDASNMFVWRVKDLGRIKNAAVWKSIQSDQFTMYGAKWYLSLYPNGDNHGNEGMIGLFLFCSDLNGFQNFECDYTFSINELNLSKSTSFNFTPEGSGFGFRAFHSNVDFLNLETIAIECTIVPKRIEKLLHDLREHISVQKEKLEVARISADLFSNKFIWKMDDLQKFKNAVFGDSFESDEFMMYGERWKLQIYPKGMSMEERFPSGIHCVGKSQKKDEHPRLFLNGLGPIRLKGPRLNVPFRKPRGIFDCTMNIPELSISQALGVWCAWYYASVSWPRLCSADHLSNLKTLTIECTIRKRIATHVEDLERTIESYERRLDADGFVLKTPVIPSVKPTSEPDPDFIASEVDQKDTDLYQKHDSIISEWNKDTARLKKLQSEENEYSGDDEKESLAGGPSINQYFEFQTLLKKQEKRINMLETNGYLVQLTERQNFLSVNASTSLSIYF